MPNITALKTAKECFDTLANLYEKKAEEGYQLEESLEEETTNFEAEQG